jgi:hypothetical protein
MTRLIMLPTDEGFNEILHSQLPANQSSNQVFGVRAETGLLEELEGKQLKEYLASGEFDHIQDLLEEEDEDEFWEWE